MYQSQPAATGATRITTGQRAWLPSLLTLQGYMTLSCTALQAPPTAASTLSASGRDARAVKKDSFSCTRGRKEDSLLAARDSPIGWDCHWLRTSPCCSPA